MDATALCARCITRCLTEAARVTLPHVSLRGRVWQSPWEAPAAQEMHTPHQRVQASARTARPRLLRPQAPGSPGSGAAGRRAAGRARAEPRFTAHMCKQGPEGAPSDATSKGACEVFTRRCTWKPRRRRAGQHGRRTRRKRGTDREQVRGAGGYRELSDLLTQGRRTPPPLQEPRGALPSAGLQAAQTHPPSL